MFHADDSEVRVAQKSSKISQALRSIQVGDDNPGEVKNVNGHEIVVRPIQSEVELDQVYQITHDAYAERGYCPVQVSGRLIHYPHLDRIAETTVLVAVIDGQIVGTNSWTLDGPNGLHVDSDFRAETDAIRHEGRRLASSWRIATKSACRSERKVVMALIQHTIHGAVTTGIETCIFTFNPRHERIYQRLLNMKTVARSNDTQGLSNAPAVLMRVDSKDIPARWLETVAVG